MNEQLTPAAGGTGLRRGCLLVLAVVAAPALAQMSVLVVIEPTERKDGLLVSRAGLESSLSRSLGTAVKVTTSDDLTDAMRSTRSAGHDVFIAPPQVVASALGHGYELLGSTDSEEQFVLVAKAGLASTADMKTKGRIYLPQQDSIYTYLARGMLNAEGLSFRDLRQVQYARYPLAGLTAISMNLAEATVIRKAEWDAWAKANPGIARTLATSAPVPGGFSVAIKTDLASDVKNKLLRFFDGAVPGVGLKPVSTRSDVAAYRRIAELGTFTPTSLPGATVVDAAAVRRLISEGAVLADTRTEREFKQSSIDGARWVPYVEKSLKDVAYDVKVDDFAGLATLDRSRPTVFLCNGAECWKSYKASKAALAAGFKQVYWFRGGMPEWQASR